MEPLLVGRLAVVAVIAIKEKQNPVEEGCIGRDVPELWADGKATTSAARSCRRERLKWESDNAVATDKTGSQY